MASTRLPTPEFYKGLCLLRRVNQFGRWSNTRSFYLMGRLVESGTPFLLRYDSGGLTNWWCQETLGDSLRKKILGLLRTSIRYADAMPSFIEVHDQRELDEANFEEGMEKAHKLQSEFFEREWRQGVLNERDEDFVDLAVPFAEKDQAKLAGARWNSARRVWFVKRQPDMSAFERWLPKPLDAPATASGAGSPASVPQSP